MADGTYGIEVGSRWAVWGAERTVEKIEPKPSRGSDLFVLLSPKPVEGKPGRYHWTDWIPARSLAARGARLIDGEVFVAETRPTRSETIVAAAEKARKGPKPLTEKRRVQNRVTSGRYKLKHPEKFGRSTWTPLERAEIEATIAAAQADLEKLKGVPA